MEEEGRSPVEEKRLGVFLEKARELREQLGAKYGVLPDGTVADELRRSREERLAKRMTTEDFSRQLNELGSVIYDGIAYFSAWQGLMVEDEDSAHALNHYGGFFLYARNALLGMAFMQFTKVFDRDPRTVSLRNLLAKAKADGGLLTPHATAEELEEIERQVGAKDAVLDRLKRLRNQRIAHHDAITPGDRSVLFGEVQELVEDIKSMYNSIQRGHDRSVTWFERLTDEVDRHTAQVVGIMRQERERAIRRI